MKCFFRQGSLAFLLCLLLCTPAFASGPDVSGVPDSDSAVVDSGSVTDSPASPHDSNDDYPVSVSDDSSITGADTAAADTAADDSSQSGSPVSVDVSGTEEPVTVQQEETEKQIVLNVTVTPPSVDVKSESPIVNVEAPIVNVEAPAAVPVDTTSDGSVSEDSDDSQSDEDAEPVPVFIPFTSLSLESDSFDSAGDSPGDTVREVLTSLFGEYKPRTQTVIKVLEDGSEVSYQEYVPGLAGLDVPWLASVVVFMLMLYCILRLLGGVLSRG